jgi:hypothetical protein
LDIQQGIEHKIHHKIRNIEPWNWHQKSEFLHITCGGVEWKNRLQLQVLSATPGRLPETKIEEKLCGYARSRD